MTNETVAAGVGKIIAAAKSISTRYATKKLTNVLAADRKLIEAGLKAIEGVDVPAVIIGSKASATPLPGAPLVGDTLAPAVPTGLSASADGTTINWTWDPSMDLYDPAATPTGVKEYDLEIDGATTVVSTANTSIQTAPTFATIGSVSPPPTKTQIGGSTTITCAGTGIDGTADECAFLYWSVTGNFRLTCRVDSFTGSGGEYAPAGLMVRESTSAGSIYAAVYQWLSALSKGVQNKKRTTTNGAKTTGTAASGDGGDRWLQIERVGDVFTYRYSTDGGTWVQLASESITMTSAVLIGAFVSDLQVSPVVNTAVFLELGYTTVSKPTYAQTGVTGTVSGRVRARDKATPGNVSGWSPSISIAGSSGEKKWTPGQYIRADAQGYPSKDAQHYATYAKAYGVSNIKGCEIPVNWYRTNPSVGVYDWSYVDDHIAEITENGTNGKKVLLTTQFQNYGGTVPSYPYDEDNSTLPNFILQAGYGATRTSGGVMPKLDITACADYWLDWIAAICQRYDTNPHVDLITVGETSSAYSGMSGSGYAAAWNRVPDVLADNAPNTWCVIADNGVTSPSTSIALQALCIAAGIGHGVEDAAGFYGSEPAQYGGWGYYARAGVGVYDDGDGNGAVDYGTYDGRLDGPMRAEQQVVRSTSVTLAQVNALMNNHWKNSHSVWALYFDASGNSYTPDFYGTSTPATAYSGTNILAFLSNAANAMTRTAYPS